MVQLDQQGIPERESFARMTSERSTKCLEVQYSLSELDMKAIGERVKTLRKSKGLSQEKIAEEAGIDNEKAISKIERGNQRLSIEQLVGIARFCGVTTDWILFGKEAASDTEVKEKLSEVMELLSNLKKSL